MGNEGLNQPASPRTDHLLGRMLLVLGAAALLAVVPFLSGLLGALILFVLTRHLHHRLARVIPARLSAFAISLAVFVLLLVPGAWLVSTIIAEGSDAIRAWQAHGSPAWVVQTPMGGFDIAGGLANTGSTLLTWLSGRAFSLFGSVTLVILNVVTGLFGLYYLLIDSALLSRHARRLIPVSEPVVELLAERFASVTEALLLGTVLTAALQGTAIGITFAILGLHPPLLWGFVTACVAVLPLFGSALVWLPGAAVLLLDHRPNAALVLVLVGAGVVSNIDNLARLFVYRRVSGIHPMLTLVGALAGVRIFGVIGAFLGPLLLSYFLELIRVYEGEFSAAAEVRREPAGD